MKKINHVLFTLSMLMMFAFTSCDKEDLVKASKVYLNKSTLELEVGQIAQLTETVMPVEAESDRVWLSSDEAVATVKAGFVTAVSEGTADVRVIVDDVEAICKVKVVGVKSEEITIKLAPTSKTLREGDTFDIEATVSPAEKYSELVWTSSDEAVATVNKGKVKALKEGTAVITAAIGEVKAECAITVIKADDKTVIIDLSQSTKDMYVGDTFTLSATVTPVGREDDLSWKSSNSEIATVSKDGLVTAIAEGSVQIIAFIDEVEEVCNVTVKKVEETLTIVLDQTTKEVEAGASFFLKATVTPSDKADELEWKSSNTSLATIAEDGLVTTKAEGEVQIIAYIDDIEAVCNLTITPKNTQTDVTITFDEYSLEMVEDDFKRISYTVEPYEMRDELVWTSSNEEVATVQYGSVSAHKIGEATITATIGEVFAECKVTVSRAEREVKLNMSTITLATSATYQLMTTVSPDAAENEELTWTSTDETIATVSEEGLVTANAEGSAIIKVQLENSIAECAVHVKGEVGEIKDSWTKYEYFNVAGYGEGIVINVSNYKGYITVMSFDFTETQWSNDPSIVVGNGANAYYEEDGIALTNAIGEKAKTYPGKFPAYDWVKSHGELWYLPSPEELYDYFDFFGQRDLNKKLEEMGKTKVPTTIWSSAETKRTPYNDAAFMDSDGYHVVEHTKNLTKGCIALMKIKFK